MPPIRFLALTFYTEMNDNDKNWLVREKKLLRNRRKYFHFDNRISPVKILPLISNPKFVKSRSFWPFIESEIKFPRYKMDPGTRRRKIEIKKRKICYASHFDSQIYSYYNHLISDYYEKMLFKYGLLDNVIAYRSLDKKCNIHFATETFKFISNGNDIAVLTFDIEKFFDSLNHIILLKQWREVIGQEYLPEDQYKIYKSLTKFAYVEREKLKKIFDLWNKDKKRKIRICSSSEFRERIRGQKIINVNLNEFGIPQGSPLSGLLSNIYMLDFDINVKKKIEEVGGYYRRYSDDLIIVCPVKLTDEIKNFVIDLIKNLCRLEINPSKTTVTIFNKNTEGKLEAKTTDGRKTYLQYLGFYFDGENIIIRSSSISRFYRKLNSRIRKIDIQRRKSNTNQRKVFKRKLYELYSHLGKRNFVSYAYRSSLITGSPVIKKQLSKHWRKLNQKIKEIEKE
jgi:RNA-directed DNA polymerase